MRIPNVNKQIFDDIFRRFHIVALVTLRKSKTKTTNYDPYRETGYAETYQNAIPVKVLPKTISAGSMIHITSGEAKIGGLAIILSDDDVELIKNSEAISINNESYYVYSEAVGNKFMLYPTEYGDYSKIILFKRDV